MLNFSSEKCNGCGLCVGDCRLFHSIELDDTNKAKKVKDGCNNCYHCVAICPKGAITIVDKPLLETRIYKPTFTSDEYLDFLKNKRSIRQYKNRMVKKGLIENIIEAGYYTPTAGNRQPVHFAVVTGEKMKKLTEITLMALKKIANEYDSEKTEINLDPKTAKAYTSIWHRFYKNYFEKGIDELFFNAPSLVLVLGDTEKVLDPKTDCILAACNIGNMAYAAGLSFCYNGFLVRAFQSEDVREFLGIDSKYKLYASMTVGYADVVYSRPVPREEKEILWV